MCVLWFCSLTKQLTFCNATTDFPAIWWNPYWWHITTQIWVARLQFSSMQFLQPFLRETSGDVAKCWLFSHATKKFKGLLTGLKLVFSYILCRTTAVSSVNFSCTEPASICTFNMKKKKSNYSILGLSVRSQVCGYIQLFVGKELNTWEVL